MEPIINEENVLLRLRLDKFVLSEDGVDEVVLSRHNAIMELRKGEILSRFQFDEPVTVVQQLKVFYSYKPKFKHYLFMNGSDLIVMRKAGDAIKVLRIYKEVMNYEIADICNSGKPNVIIYLVNQEPPIVTDCISVKSLSSTTYNHVHTSAPYVQKSMLRIKNAEKILQEKTKVISKLSNVLAFNCNDDRILSLTDQLVFLKEGLASAFIGLPAKGNALSVGKPWLKTYLGFWVIGFPIVNISKKDIFSFEMFVSHHCITVKKTLLFTKTNKAGEVEFYRQSFKLLDEQFGMLVAVMQEPHLIAETYSLTCVTCFENSTSDEPEQIFLGNLEVNTSELENYSLFSPHLSANDLISIQAASKSFELSFKSILNISELLIKMESSHLFRRLSETVFLDSRTSGKFCCLLLIVDSDCNRIRVFASTENDFLFLAHKLTDSLGENMTFDHPKNDPLQAVVITLKEIKYIKGIIINELIGSENSCSPTTSVNLEEAFRDMMLLEIDSAAAMNSLKMYS